MGKRVTLVLDGGAVRGLAHIGVIRVLELIQDYLGQESSQGSDRPALSKVLIISFETMQEHFHVTSLQPIRRIC